AGDQGDRTRALQLDDPVVILAGEQAQRETDHAGTMAEHPLDGEVSLAGIGRPEDRDKPRSGAEDGHAFKVSDGKSARARGKRAKNVRDARQRASRAAPNGLVLYRAMSSFTARSIKSSSSLFCVGLPARCPQIDGIGRNSARRM